MVKQIFSHQELPMEELGKLRLVTGGNLQLDNDDVQALLTGRRTDMLRMENLYLDGFHLPALDAKLSLRREPDGNVALLAHPIYKTPQPPAYLTDSEAEHLEKGKAVNVQKTISDGEGDKREVLVEFDRDTNEFIVIDTEQIIAPEAINGIPLTPEQKERYRKGREIESNDGTRIQYSATDKRGIRSDRLALIASVLIDGGISYLLFKGLNAIFNEPRQKEPGSNFDQALSAMSASDRAALGMSASDEEEHSKPLSR
jgi:hypothetical protein